MKEVWVETQLYEEIKTLVKKRPELGYLNVTEFIREAVRMAFRKIEDREI